MAITGLGVIGLGIGGKRLYDYYRPPPGYSQEDLETTIAEPDTLTDQVSVDETTIAEPDTLTDQVSSGGNYYSRSTFDSMSIDEKSNFIDYEKKQLEKELRDLKEKASKMKKFQDIEPVDRLKKQFKDKHRELQELNNVLGAELIRMVRIRFGKRKVKKRKVKKRKVKKRKGKKKK